MPASPRLADLVADSRAELVFAVVAPTGVDLDALERVFIDLLRQFNYETKVIRLSGLAERLHTEKLGVTVDRTSEYARINSLMTLGNKLRSAAGRGDVLALHAVAEISAKRTDGESMPRTAHLLRSLKHPDEVEALRRVYGPGFFLIGIYSPEDKRFEYLKQRKGLDDCQSSALLRRDQDEPDDLFGQHTRDTYTLSDVFVSEDKHDELSRFLELVFGHPFHTPRPDEHAMFLAYAASLRSAQLARQVGAVVISAGGEVIGIGANDVPKYGGGQYWPGEGDQRDHCLGGDSNDREISEIINDTVTRLGSLLPEGADDKARSLLSAGRISDLTEFGRVVHAEMEALLACARAGVSVKGATLFTTTFPCHNCAKHIVSAGVDRVIYVEPYPKSRAFDLHADSISLDDPDREDTVRFLSFVGVAARKYFDLFSMRLSSGLPMKRKVDGKAIEWERSTATPRIRMSPYTYADREQIAVELINRTVEQMDPEKKSSADVSGHQGQNQTSPPRPIE